jgi:hypothetical protein
MGTMETKSIARKKRPKVFTGKSRTFKTELIRIGRSRGIIFPEAVIKKAGFCDEVEIHVSPDWMELRGPGWHPRAG